MKESIDNQITKEDLERKAKAYQSELKSQLDELKEASKEWGSKALLVGGTLYASYKLFKKLNPSKQKKHAIKSVKTNKHSFPFSKNTFWGKLLKEQFLLAFLYAAKKMLKNYLSDRSKN